MLGCAERAISELANTAAPASCLSAGFFLLLSSSPSCSASSERTFYISLTKHSLFVFYYSIFHSFRYWNFTISLDQRGWLTELGWRLASSKRFKKNVQLLTRGLTLPACRPQPLCSFVLFIQDVDMAYCSWEVTGLNNLPLIVLLNAGSCELAMTGSGVQKALRQTWLWLREDVSTPLALSELIGKGKHAPPASWRVAQDSFDK